VKAQESESMHPEKIIRNRQITPTYRMSAR
jgi:hypothetical protein